MTEETARFHHIAADLAINHVEKYGGLVSDGMPNFDQRTIEILCENSETEIRILRELEKSLVTAGGFKDAAEIAAERPRIYEFLIAVYKVYPALRPEVARPINGAARVLRVLRDQTWALGKGGWRSEDHRKQFNELRDRADDLEVRLDVARQRAKEGAKENEIEAILGDVKADESSSEIGGRT